MKNTHVIMCDTCVIYDALLRELHDTDPYLDEIKIDISVALCYLARQKLGFDYKINLNSSTVY